MSQPTKAETTIVRPGDTLWSIAVRHLGGGMMWPTLYALNAKQIKAEQQRRGARPKRPEDLIYEGTVLELTA